MPIIVMLTKCYERGRVRFFMCVLYIDLNKVIVDVIKRLLCIGPDIILPVPKMVIFLYADRHPQ